MIVGARDGDSERLAVGLASHGSRPALSLSAGRKKWKEEEEIRVRINCIRV
jgi:hypothetical protein